MRTSEISKDKYVKGWDILEITIIVSSFSMRNIGNSSSENMSKDIRHTSILQKYIHLGMEPPTVYIFDSDDEVEFLSDQDIDFKLSRMKQGKGSGELSLQMIHLLNSQSRKIDDQKQSRSVDCSQNFPPQLEFLLDIPRTPGYHPTRPCGYNLSNSSTKLISETIFEQGSYSTSQTDDYPKLPFLSTKKEEDCSKTESRIRNLKDFLAFDDNENEMDKQNSKDEKEFPKNLQTTKRKRKSVKMLRKKIAFYKSLTAYKQRKVVKKRSTITQIFLNNLLPLLSVLELQVNLILTKLS